MLAFPSLALPIWGDSCPLEHHLPIFLAIASAEHRASDWEESRICDTRPSGTHRGTHASQGAVPGTPIMQTLCLLQWNPWMGGAPYVHPWPPGRGAREREVPADRVLVSVCTAICRLGGWASCIIQIP